MNRQALKHILQSNYDRDQWISTLQFLTGKREYLTVHLTPKTIEINTQEADRIVKTFYQIGSLKTSDGISLPIFEIILEDDIRIEYNKVGVNDFIKKYIIKDAVKGALTTFSYDKDHEKKEWRFSFISKNSANDFFAEAEAEETNPKKYTYIFGTEEEHRTAIERLYNLEQSRFRLEDFFEAFNVEPVSKKFFEEYKSLYKQFSSFLADEKNEYRKIFEAEINDFNSKTKEDVEKEIDKDIRNFVSRLMGRMVFLYFLQKKHWLGASNQKYKDGSSTFLSDLFYNDKESQKDFYQKYLSKIFFEALNTPDRKNEEFTLHDGKTVCIPFLNGGLFEEEQEPKGHRKIQFPDFYFEDLFKFFNGYNFTIYENSPEEHTVAVDPEMLGHIFENLIDYNKDTGTFYTPKEIVQYMTQESLIEYLNTHLQKERKEIENLLKNHYTKPFNNVELEKINQLLDEVKICDPAIGSGAFPMGMLQEIFNLKAVIAYELKKEWNPAQVKQDIIQNSIYGVDLDEGAVEIARLRFWLSLVVDEGIPKALPNLDYKIMQGNSLLESYNDIDLSNLATADEQIISNQQTVLEFGDEYAKEITVFDAVSIEEIQSLIKSYFTKSGNEKAEIKQRLNNIIEGKIHSKIYKEKKRLETLINDFYKKYNLSKDNDLSGFNLKSKEIKELFSNKEQFNNLEKIENELISFQHKSERPYFLWHLYFKEIFDNGGFDIVIGNPPYGTSIKGNYRDFVIEKYGKVPDFEIYYFFIELSKLLLKKEAILCYIIPNTYLFNTFAEQYRIDLLKNWNLVEILDCTQFNIFQSATVRNTINLWKVGTTNEVGYRKTKNIKSFSQLTSNKRINIDFHDLLKLNQNWGLAFMLDKITLKVIDKIEISGDKLQNFCDVSQGYIPYRRSDLVKKYGNIEGNRIVDFRLWHSDKKIDESYLPEIFGKELDKFGVLSEKKAKSFIKYGKHLAGYIELKYFNQQRILVREITNPKIIATIIDELYVNDPQLISIIVKSSSVSYSFIWTILNSKLATFYHFNHSPKATKGAFPKILVKDIKEFPIVIPENIIPFEILADYLIFLNNKTQKEDLGTKIMISYFEQIVDGMVYELYFPELLKNNNRDILQYLQDIQPIDNYSSDEKIKEIIDSEFKRLDDNKHPVKNNLFFMKNLEEIEIIENLK